MAQSNGPESSLQNAYKSSIQNTSIPGTFPLAVAFIAVSITSMVYGLSNVSLYSSEILGNGFGSQLSLCWG